MGTLFEIHFWYMYEAFLGDIDAWRDTLLMHDMVFAHGMAQVLVDA